jgi:ankyrin repeat protein
MHSEAEAQWRAALASDDSATACGELLRAGADVNFRMAEADCPAGDTPLILAAGAGEFETCEVLIAAGADVNLGNECGRTALHLAATSGHAHVCKFLLENGAAVDPRTTIDGSTPLHWAGSRPPVIEVLLGAGASINLATEQGFTPLWETVSWKSLEHAVRAFPFLGMPVCKANT